MEATRTKYLDLIHAIRSKIQQRNNGNKDAFPAKECFLCPTCAYRTICPLFSHGYHDDETVQLEDMKTGTIKHLVDRLAQLTYQLKTIETEKDYLAKLL